MRRDPTQFRERFKQWKNGAKVYEAGLPKYEDGKDSFNAQATYDSNNDVYNLRYALPETTIIGHKRPKPFKWVSASTPLLTAADVAKAYSVATVGLLPNYISAVNNLMKGNIKLALSDAWLYNNIGSGNPNVNYGVVGFSAPEGSLFNSVSKATRVTPKQWNTAYDAAYKSAVESGNKQEAYRLLEQAYLNSGIQKTPITVTPDGKAIGWFHGSEWGNHTIFDSNAMNATIGGLSAAGRIKGNFMTTDLPSAVRYAGGNKYRSITDSKTTVPTTFIEKILNVFGKYKPRRLYPAERVGEYAPKPERLFDTEGKAPINHLDKTDNVVYPLYVNPGEDVMSLDFQGKPWSQSPIKFPNNFYLKRHIRDDVARTYRDEIVPYKDYKAAYKAWTEDPINIRRGRTSLDEVYFDDGIRSIEGFNSAPRYETVRLVEELVPNTTGGAVQTAAKEGKTSVLMRNVIDSNGGPDGIHYAIDDFVTLKPEQMKLADITYDDAGNLIPLSQRFNWNLKDIRYAIAPLLFGVGTGAHIGIAKQLNKQ